MSAKFMPFLTNALDSRRRIVLAAAMVFGINSVGLTSNPQNLSSVGTAIYFVSVDGLHSPEIWKTDGTGSGTRFVVENLQTNNFALPTELTAPNGQFFFASNGGLWRTDGTTVGITLDLAVTSLQALQATNLSLTLSVGTVNETVLGTAKDDTIRGNDAANILVGNAGNEVLQGRAGRDILIGGSGVGKIDGGANDDKLIGRKTKNDAVIGKLNDIRVDWISPNLHAARIANLRAGVGASNASLNAKGNVTNDGTSGSGDTLTGGPDQDWYYKAVDDVTTDLLAGEILDPL